ncbi:MAG TPA: hypothetical protein ENJ91_03760 [Rhodobacteraceae bacterium]|nr:hypothetical protein [Paracoccaceae bacterium]
MSPSPACWASYGEVLAREYSDTGYWRSHRLLTDAYCGQHSIGEDRRARQSLWIHMAALILHFEDGAGNETIVDFLRRAAKSRHGFDWLEMPEASLSVRLDEVHAAPDAAAHHAAVAQYARAVFDAWAVHHAAFRGLIEEVGA